MSHANSQLLAPYKTLDVHAFVFDTGSMTWVPAEGGAVGTEVVVTNVVSVTATDLDIRDLNSAQDSVTVIQGTSPWVVAFGGTLTVDQGTSPWVIAGVVAAVQSGSWAVEQAGAWVVAATQSGAWSVGRTWVLSFGTDSVDVSGSLVGAAQSGVWTVAATQSGAWAVSATQGTSPWVVSGTVAATQSGAWSVGRTWDLEFATDQVNVSGSAVTMRATDPAGPTVEDINTNSTVTLLASAVRAATTASAAQVNRNWRGVHVTLNTTAVPGGGQSLTPQIQAQDPVTAAWYNVLVGTAFTTTGLRIYKVGNIAPLAGGAAQDILPRNWRVNVVHSGAGNWTYSVGANLCV